MTNQNSLFRLDWLVFYAAFLIGLSCTTPLQAQPAGDTLRTISAEPTKAAVDLKHRATDVLNRYCVDCHGPESEEASVRLDAFDLMDEVEQQKLFAKVQRVIQLSEMPPSEAQQPTSAERKLVLGWLENQLTGQAAKALSEKLMRFEYGNVVDHHDLFSGDYAHLPGSTPDRRWLISEFIFTEKINRLLNYQPTRKVYGTNQSVQGDSGVHWSPKTEWGNKFRRTITNPFLLPPTVGVRYSAHPRLTTGHLLTMIGNAKRVANHMTNETVMKANYPAVYAVMKKTLEERARIESREKFMRTFPFLERLLKEIYGRKHDSLQPQIKHLTIPYPGPPKHSNNGIQGRHENLEFLGRFDAEDIQAIMQGIATYKRSGFAVKVDDEKSQSDRNGNPVWSPYTSEDVAEFDHLIKQCERDWFLEGVSDYRIENRITTMKLFFDTWDMNLVYAHVRDGDFGSPKYQPLPETEMGAIRESILKHRQKGDRHQDLIEKCLQEWQDEYQTAQRHSLETDNTVLKAAIVELYRIIFERIPTRSEITENIDQLKSYLSKLEPQRAVGKLIESMLLSTEFSYRNEFGFGETDSYGRRLMPPREAGYAMSYALTDSSPDPVLIAAIEEGRLNSRADYEREVRRMLARRDQWYVIDESVQAANLNPSITNQPIRKLRFFREFFGYPKAIEVFKDDSRFGAGRHEQAVSRLIDEADLLVEYILEKDQRVFEELLTTERFFVYHSGDNNAMTSASRELRRVYDYFRDLNWQDWKPEDIAPHRSFMLTIWEFQKVRGGDDKSLLTTLKRMMSALDLHFSQGQSNGLPYMKAPMGFWNGGNVLGRTGQQMRGEEVTTYWNLDWRTWDYPTQQPAVIENRKGLLTHPAWLIAHSQNLETDPIHRGKWIREKLLAGTIPDVPITVDAVIPPDHHKTLRQRMEDRTGQQYCWRCHQNMDPLGFPFENYDDFGRFRTEESLEHPENLLKEAKRGETNRFGASLPEYKTLPVDPRGVLEGTADPILDGDVENAFDLIDRLAQSDKVRQSIIRHAFRFFLGRNETLADSKTLMDAEQAYLKSNGSFDEVVVSLLCSDSFVYRQSEPKK